MPLFMDRHDLPNATAEEVAAAHAADLVPGAKHGVQFLVEDLGRKAGYELRKANLARLKGYTEATHVFELVRQPPQVADYTGLGFGDDQ